MPLIIVCGRPASGKSHITTKITSAFVSKLEHAKTQVGKEQAKNNAANSQDISLEDRVITQADKLTNKNTTTSIPTSQSTTTAPSCNTSHNTKTTENGKGAPSNTKNPPNNSKNDDDFPLFYKKVITIGDSEALKELNLHRNEAFENTHKLEKRLRGNLKAATERALANKDNLVILDHGNYIKGWRYELHCMAKSTRTKSMILYIEDDDEGKFLENNNGREDSEEAYSEEILHALNFRFEAPNSKNRWDSPMETISNLDHSSLNPESLIRNLAKHFTGETGGAKIKPNNSTQQPKKSNLSDMEGMTLEIVNRILKARQNGQLKITLPDGQIVECPGSLTQTDGEIRRARRQFFDYVRGQNRNFGAKNMEEDIGGMFVKFLKTALN